VLYLWRVARLCVCAFVRCKARSALFDANQLRSHDALHEECSLGSYNNPQSGHCWLSQETKTQDEGRFETFQNGKLRYAVKCGVVSAPKDCARLCDFENSKVGTGSASLTLNFHDGVPAVTNIWLCFVLMSECKTNAQI